MKKIFDFLFSNFEWYRKLCSGEWKHVCIVINEPGKYSQQQIKKWVRGDVEIVEKHWVMNTFEKDVAELMELKKVAEKFFKRELEFSELVILNKKFRETKGSIFHKACSAIEELDESINHTKEKLTTSFTKADEEFQKLKSVLDSWQPKEK